MLPSYHPYQALEKELLFTNGKNVYNIDGLALRTHPHPTPAPSLADTCHGATCSGYTYSGYTYSTPATTCAGDNLRTGLTRDLGFSAEDRGESVRRASEVRSRWGAVGGTQ